MCLIVGRRGFATYTTRVVQHLNNPNPRELGFALARVTDQAFVRKCIVENEVATTDLSKMLTHVDKMKDMSPEMLEARLTIARRLHDRQHVYTVLRCKLMNM